MAKPPSLAVDAGKRADAAQAPPPVAADASASADSSADVEPVCERGELECHGSLMARCNEPRSDFELMRDCRNAALCDRAALRCSFGACSEQELGCSLPELQPSWEGVYSVALGRQFTCAVITAGGLRCWGRNHHGQLGYGRSVDVGGIVLPASAGNVDVGGPVAQVAAGRGHTCALFTNGEVACWGDAGSRGLLGYGDTERRKHFVELSGLSLDVGDDETPASVGRIQLGAPAIQLAAGEDFTCALLMGGAVRCWGEGEDGVLGYGNVEDIGDDETPASMQALELGGPAVFIAAGATHSCAILRTGEVRCWGRGSAGQLGYGNAETIGDDETPASAGSVALHERAIGLSASETHTCAILRSGALQCWGNGQAQQLGHDAREIIGDDERPTARPALDLGARVAQVAAGKDYTCALLEGGAVRCWGVNQNGQLGTGVAGSRPLSSAPPRIDLGADAVQIEAYRHHTCAVLSTRELSCWGFGYDGNLGYGNSEDVGDDETPASVGVVPVLRIPPDPEPPPPPDQQPLPDPPPPPDRPSRDPPTPDPPPPPEPGPLPELVADAGVPSPNPDPVPIDAGLPAPDPDPPAADAGLPPTSACEIGVLRCEGSRVLRCNESGSSLDFVTDCSDATLCVQAIASCELRSCTVEELRCPPAGPGADARRVESVAIGDQHTCVLTVSGAVRCWGDNEFGQLGYGHTRDIGLEEPAAFAAEVDVGGPVQQIVAGESHTCALLVSGEVRCWGRGDDGQLGLGNPSNVGDDELPSSVPSIDLGGPVRQLAAGGGGFTCALLLDESVRCWGSGSRGQLGLGSIISTANRNIGDDETPVSVNAIDVGSPVASIAAGQNHVCALSKSGEVRCWGTAAAGRLGYGNTRNIGDDEAPASAGSVAVGGLAIALSLGSSHTCAVLFGGAVRCWGSQLSGALGQPDPVPFGASLGDGETPDSVPPLDFTQPALQIAAGVSYGCVLLADGAVRCWGKNNFGQLGSARSDATIPLSAALPRLDLGADAIMIAAGEAHACAVLDSREVVCWGDVSNGKLGYGQGGINARVGDDETPASMGPVPLF